jgi:hypothetical protein
VRLGVAVPSSQHEHRSTNLRHSLLKSNAVGRVPASGDDHPWIELVAWPGDGCEVNHGRHVAPSLVKQLGNIVGVGEVTPNVSARRAQWSVRRY